MNIITRSLTVILFTFILSGAVLAISNHSFRDENFLMMESNKIRATVQNKEIPFFVVDTNFNWWQPAQPVQMIPSFERQDVAWTNGFVIFYNPTFSQRIPAKVAAFVLAHEYGHIYGQTGDENYSDAFAARVYAETDQSVCEATVWWLINFPNPGDATHLPTPMRARNIARECGLD